MTYYKFDVMTTYDDTKKYTETFAFTINETEYRSLKENVAKSLICRISNNYGMTANMYTLLKQFENGGQS